VGAISYVVFILNNEEYGIEISYAQEILRVPEQLTLLPNMPSYIEGVINLRGKVIPVIELKKRFGFSTEQCTDSRLLIIKYEDTQLALKVDDVSEIISLEEEAVQQLNSVISQIGNNSLKGIGKFEDRLILLIDVLRLDKEVFHGEFEMEDAG
jgi:purine-binding chemotaxis protein CheW